jgi:hypothetical protein
MLPALRRRLDRSARGDSGVTLVEMSVTSLVLALLMSSLVMMVVASNRIAMGVNERLTQTNQATIAMERMTRNLRTAVLQSQLTSACVLTTCTDSAFLLGGPTSVQFYADVDNPNNTVGPSRVTYSVTSGVLTETVQKPDSPTPDANGYHYCTPSTTCVVRSTVLATGVQSTADVFTYYTAAAPTTAMTMSTGGVLSAAQLKTVDSIDVTLTVVVPGGANVAGATLSQRVALPNADSVIRTDGT